MPETSGPADLLKADLLGRVEKVSGPCGPAVRRDPRAARWWVRPLARWLARREARALRALEEVPDVPALLPSERGVVLRTWIDGAPMQLAQPRHPWFFRRARRLLAQVHRRGVTHNDLAKEPNWLVRNDGAPGLVDFQLAFVFRRRGALFRFCAREDLRHLLKHKRTYCPERLTARERRLLAAPSCAAHCWRRTGKRAYLWITRGMLGWADREGAGDRGSSR